jgi:thioesterase DpgC
MPSTARLPAECSLSDLEVAECCAAMPLVLGNYDADLETHTRYWTRTSQLVARLPGKAKRSDAEQEAAKIIQATARASRDRFLGQHAVRMFDTLTNDRTRFLRVPELVAAAGKLCPGLLPSDAQLASESNAIQSEKDGLEIDQGIFLSHVLANRDSGTHLCHAMLLPKAESRDHAVRFQATGKLDLGTVRLARDAQIVRVTTSNPNYLNAEDATTLDNMEVAVDVATLDPNSNVVVIRGDHATHAKYAGRRVFGAGINLTHLYDGKIPFLWFMTRELGFMNKIFRGVAGPDVMPDDLHGGGVEKPWVAAVDSFAIGGHCQLLLCMDYVVAATNAKLTLPARKEGIIPGLANLRLPRFTGLRLGRQMLQYGLELHCGSAEAESICDEVVDDDQMDAGIDRVCKALLRSGRSGMIANRRAFRVGLEPLDLFRQYCALYSREQAYCHFGPELIANLENNWNAGRSRSA